ncbi:low-density lipoprotein receptor-related protein 3 [Trichonephila clavipes]|nr:low-density lipoprotein receptor-related protein 3 [Trichonephila clavipes]
MCVPTNFIYLSNTRAWLLDRLTPSLPVPTDEVVSRVFIESSELEQVVSIHSGMAAEFPGFVSSQAKPVDGPRHRTHSDQSFPWLSKALCLLDNDSIVINECGNNALCFSESQGDFLLG